jgi:hypothetical protein
MFISELDPADPRASASDAILKSDAIFKRAKDAVAGLKALMAELEAAQITVPAHTIINEGPRRDA